MTRDSITSASLEFKRRLVRAFGSETTTSLFGSAARGDHREFSDIDVLVLLPFEPDISVEERIFDMAYDVELEHGVVFGVLVFSRAFWDSDIARAMPLHRNIEREGVGV